MANKANRRGDEGKVELPGEYRRSLEQYFDEQYRIAHPLAKKLRSALDDIRELKELFSERLTTLAEILPNRPELTEFAHAELRVARGCRCWSELDELERLLEEQTAIPVKKTPVAVDELLGYFESMQGVADLLGMDLKSLEAQRGRHPETD